MMQSKMIHTDRVLIVEGKYDAVRLAHLTDAMILLTDGFGIYKDKQRQQLFRALAQKNGLILPVVTLALYPMAYITRLTRSSMLDVLGQDYIRTARAKGVPGFKVIFGHALKNSLIPVITYFGPMLAYIVTGSIVVEQIFAVPGIGRAFVNSITGRDYPLIMGTTIILACLIIIMNLVSDLLYKIVDPRIELD